MHELQGARALDLTDLKVAEPARPPGPEATLALECSRRARLRGRQPSLRLESDRLIVRHPVLLTEPLVAARDDVAVAADDTRRREGGDTVRFPYSHEFEWTQPFPGDEAETYGWLYVRGGRSPLPYLCDVQELPNLVVVFREPLAPLACRTRRKPGRPLPRPPVPGRALPGFFARVCDPDAARLALRDWGVMRALTVTDAERAAAALDAKLAS
ncbi:MAG: hypothetical protein QOJ12_2918 [Thermoleophilales bacterium]|nr:hypothetical protein [Thermoleophilales bacterium]